MRKVAQISLEAGEFVAFPLTGAGIRALLRRLRRDSYTTKHHKGVPKA
jgi:hypothetical protein